MLEIFALQVFGLGLLNSEILRVDFLSADVGAFDFVHKRGAGGGDFVEPVAAVDDEGVHHAEASEGDGHETGGFGRGGSDELGLGSGGIGEWAEEVEGGTGFEFEAGGLGVLHRRVEDGGVEEADAAFADAEGHLFGLEVDVDAEGLEDVGTAAVGADGAVAVLGDVDSGAGDDEGRDGGDVEGGEAVAAGAAGVDEELVFELGVDAEDFGTHGAGEAVDLVGGLAFHFEGGEEGGQLGGGGLAFEDDGHGLFGIGGGEVFAGHHAMEE